MPVNEPLTPSEVRRKFSPKSVDIGSVKLSGQKISIRIISSRYLKEHKLSRYMYEVISKKSKYYQNVDYICSRIALKEGHCYVVTFNKEMDNPRILRLMKEIECRK